MRKAPIISVVTPTYNSAAYLSATVESVLAQTFVDWELVLFDDGSTDRSVEICRDFATQDPRIRFAAGCHGGISLARNRGLKRTDQRSAFVTFLDSDDVWEPHALNDLKAELDRRPECAAAYGLARAIDADGRQFANDSLAEFMRHRREIRDRRFVDLPIDSPTSFQTELIENYVVTPGTSLIRRDVVEQLGGYEPSLAVCEDWDMNLRIARHGGFALLDRIVLSWRRHGSSTSHQAGRLWRHAHVAVLKRAALSSENSPEQRKAAEFALRCRSRAALSTFCRQLAHGRVRAAASGLLYAALYLAAYSRAGILRKRLLN